MKTIKLIVGLIVLTSLNLSAQETLSFEKVIKTDSVGKKIIFATINDWFATTYNSSNDVIQMNDKDAGILIGKGLFEYNSNRHPFFSQYEYDGNIKYTIKIYVKDNRYKVVLTDFEHLGDLTRPSYSFSIITTAEDSGYKGPYQKFHNENWRDIKLECEEYSKDIFTSLENKTKNIKVETSGDDW